jgi:hypothetical protein
MLVDACGAVYDNVVCMSFKVFLDSTLIREIDILSSDTNPFSIFYQVFTDKSI